MFFSVFIFEALIFLKSVNLKKLNVAQGQKREVGKDPFFIDLPQDLKTKKQRGEGAIARKKKKKNILIF